MDLKIASILLISATGLSWDGVSITQSSGEALLITEVVLGPRSRFGACDHYLPMHTKMMKLLEGKDDWEDALSEEKARKTGSTVISVEKLLITVITESGKNECTLGKCDSILNPPFSLPQSSMLPL